MVFKGVTGCSFQSGKRPLFTQKIGSGAGRCFVDKIRLLENSQSNHLRLAHNRHPLAHNCPREPPIDVKTDHQMLPLCLGLTTTWHHLCMIAFV